jgi:hypothetical protein
VRNLLGGHSKGMHSGAARKLWSARKTKAMAAVEEQGAGKTVGNEVFPL